MFGKRLWKTRGGASQAASAESTTTTSRAPFTCVMQAPPPLSSLNAAAAASSAGGERQANGSTSKNRKKNGASRRQITEDLLKDVVTAAEYVAETKLPTDIGQFQLRAYRVPGAPMGQEPCVIYSRDKPPFGNSTAFARSVPVRIHDQCLTSEVFRSQR
jgi:GTP cyclohydrolase II